MARNQQMTIEQAKATAERMERQQESWDAQADQQAWDAQVASHYGAIGPVEIAGMWETAKNEQGKPLSKFELAALVERWCELFGCLPPNDNSTPAPPPAPVEPGPEGTDMMTRADVARKLRASVSSVQRMERDGRLPRAARLGARGRRHLARDVDALIEKLDDQRNAPAPRKA